MSLLLLFRGGGGGAAAHDYLEWSVKVDWEADGTFVDAIDDISDVVASISVSGGRSGATDRFGPTQCSLMCDNADGRFTRYNASSPLYGLMKSGREIVVTATFNGVTYPQFRGRLTEVSESFALGQVPAVTLTCHDGFEALRKTKVRVALMEGVRVDEAITAVLDAADWPAGLRDLDVAVTTLDYYAVVAGTAAADALQELAEQEMGQLFIARDGSMTFRNRDARSAAASAATIAEVLDSAMTFRGEDLVDGARFTWAGLVLGAAVEQVYELSPDGRRIKPGSTDPLNLIEGTYEPALVKTAISPVATTDYNADSAADGSGTSKTAQITVSSFEDYGAGFRLRLANADSAAAYLYEDGGAPGLQVRGTPIRRLDEMRVIEVEASTPPGSGQYLERELLWNNDADEVAAMARLAAEVLSSDKPRPALSLPCATADEMAFMLGIESGQRLTLDLDGTDPTRWFNGAPELAGDFFVEQWSVDLVPEIAGECSLSMTLWSADHGFGTMFRVSPDVGDALSVIDGADRIWA